MLTSLDSRGQFFTLNSVSVTRRFSFSICHPASLYHPLHLLLLYLAHQFNNICSLFDSVVLRKWLSLLKLTFPSYWPSYLNGWRNLQGLKVPVKESRSGLSSKKNAHCITDWGRCYCPCCVAYRTFRTLLYRYSNKNCNYCYDIRVRSHTWCWKLTRSQAFCFYWMIETVRSVEKIAERYRYLLFPWLSDHLNAIYFSRLHFDIT